MRQAKVFYKGEEAGVLTQNDDGSFTFNYHNNWLVDITKPAISLTLPKNKQKYEMGYLFPFFYNMLPEGTNKKVVCRRFKIDENDHFSLLVSTAQVDTVGAITIEKV